MAIPPQQLSEQTSPRIRVGRVGSVDLYEIKDMELEQLEKGSPADLQFNFAIFLLSLAFAAICSLATATFPNQDVKVAFILVVIVGIVLGGYLLISWIRTRVSISNLCKTIRERIPPDITEVPQTSIDDIPEQPKG